MRLFNGIGRALRALWRGCRAIGRGLAWLGRPLRRFFAWVWRSLTIGVRRPEVRQLLAWAVAAIAALIAFGTAGTVYDVDRLGWGLMPFVGAIVGLPFGLIVTRPLTGLLVSVATAYLLGQLLPIVDDDPWSWLVIHGLVMLSLLFAACARESGQRAVAAWLVTSSLFYWGTPPDISGGWVVGVTIVAAGGLLVGRLVLTSQALVRQEEVSSAEKARRVVLEERARIARDLHDIVAHHMSLVVVQAETAGYRVPELSEPARAELLSIGETARSALSETRALLAVLRQDGQVFEDAPQPGLTQVGDLVDAAQRAGVRLEAQVSGDISGLRPGVSLAGYRIAQEALANVARHARGAPVRLEAQPEPGGVRLRVENGPVPGADPVVAGAPGHGITGMRERAAAAGGRLELGPTEAGGFVVDLFLPTDGEEPSAGTGAATPPAAIDPAGRSETSAETRS